MKRYFATVLVAAFIAVPALVGCDDTLSKKETVKTRDDGTVVHQKDEVKQTPNGDIVKEHQKTVDKP